MRMSIRGAARLLRVSPRTVSRAIANDINGHIQEDELTSTDTLGFIYDCPPSVFELAYQGSPAHVLLTPQEAIAHMKMTEREFKYRRKKGKIKPVLSYKQVVRYTREYLDSVEL